MRKKNLNKVGEYSSAQHQRICNLESKLKSIIRAYESKNDSGLCALIIIAKSDMECRLSNNPLCPVYHENYTKWYDNFHTSPPFEHAE
jgi:hypothetical protein